MAEMTAPQSPGLTPDEEEAAFYHEAALNAAWTGSRLAAGSLSFGFGAFIFAFFYLKSLNSHGLWYPAGFTGPKVWLGTLIAALIVVSAVIQTVGLQRIKAASKGAWLTAATVTLVLGLAAVGLQIYQLLSLSFWPGANGFASVFTGSTPVYLIVALTVLIWLETLIMRCRAIPAISFVEQPPTFTEAFAVQRFQSALSAFTVIWNYLAVVAVVMWVLFYVVH
jgi:heme/copper-type cytochrome/quinol oxidase subunit 3